MFTDVVDDDDEQAAASLIRRNTIVAAASITLGTSNWLWRYTHPERPLSILFDLQAKSAPLAAIGRNGRPTVVDIWAPWCETCQQAAATLAAVETQYAGRVNFVVLNGDDWEAHGKVIAALGADAIPHVAMIEADGTVSTALIGAVPKRILEADIEVLLENAAGNTGQRKALPHQMYDAFQGRPENARRVLF